MSIGLLQNIYGYGGNRKMNVIVFTRAKPRVSAVFAVERCLCVCLAGCHTPVLCL